MKNAPLRNDESHKTASNEKQLYTPHRAEKNHHEENGKTFELLEVSSVLSCL